MCCKAIKTLGFVMRLEKDYEINISVKVLFCTLVCVLEYSCVVWEPNTTSDSS